MDRCVICYCTVREGSRVQKPSSSKNKGKGSPPSPAVEQQLSVLFLLDNLLNVSQIKDRFPALLKRKGNPSTWIRLCYPCSVWVEDGKRIFREMAQLQKDFEDIREKVESTIRRTWDGDESEDKGSICSVLRNAVVNRSNEEPIVSAALNPFSSVEAIIKHEKDDTIYNEEEEEFMDSSFFEGIDDSLQNDDEIADDSSKYCLISPDCPDEDASVGEDDNTDSDTEYEPEPVKTKRRREREPQSGGDDKQEGQRPRCSMVHKYFEYFDNYRMRCKLCGKELSKPADGNTSTRLRHLKCYHKDLVGNSQAGEDENNGTASNFRYQNQSWKTPRTHGVSIVHPYFEAMETTFRCKLCGIELTKTSNSGTSSRLRHLKTRHNQIIAQISDSSSSTTLNEEPCDICGKPFYLGGNLLDHKWTHLSEEEKVEKSKELGLGPDTQCSICSLPFLRPSGLKIHLALTHNIGKEEDTSQHLHRYRKTCQVCGKRFSGKDHYKSHIKLHLTLVDPQLWEKYCAGEKISLMVQKDENGRIISIEPPTAESVLLVNEYLTLVNLEVDNDNEEPSTSS